MQIQIWEIVCLNMDSLMSGYYHYYLQLLLPRPTSYQLLASYWVGDLNLNSWCLSFFLLLLSFYFYYLKKNGGHLIMNGGSEEVKQYVSYMQCTVCSMCVVYIVQYSIYIIYIYVYIPIYIYLFYNYIFYYYYLIIYIK